MSRVTPTAGPVPDKERARAGLCSDCRNMRRVESDRGSIFYMCDLSSTDPRFAKYPRLPVVECSGYEKRP
jgi:hypothetical protein